jgi:NAD(P)-dependent dehydrogenase (short-subunit alcohol dehydrogenase family)
MAHWTAADIPDLTGRTAVVTGANSGLGFETSIALAQQGAAVVMASRDEGRCAIAAERLRELVPSACVEPACLDLADLGSVRAFAEDVGTRYDRLDILVNNAGVMAPPKRLTTKQGFELQFGTNHLGHFALTGLLIPALLREAGSRVVTVSSTAYQSGEMNFDDLQHERDYTPYGAYSDSKLANLLFMLKLDEAFELAAVDTLSVGAHPGLVRTNLHRAGPFLESTAFSSRLVAGAVRVVGQSAARGAEPQLYAATAPGVEGGNYFGPRSGMRGPAALSRIWFKGRDADHAARLWDVSKHLTGVDIDEAIAAARTERRG